MTFGTLESFLTEHSTLETTLGQRRSFAGETYAVVKQVLRNSEMETEKWNLPTVVRFEDATSDELLDWWNAFRTWLGSLTESERDWLNRQIVSW